MIENPIFNQELFILLGIVNLFLFAFLLFGSFLIIRDRWDVIHLKLIENKEEKERDKDISIFNLIQKEDIPFFEIQRVILYPIGVFLTSISINAIVFGSNFLPIEIFNLDFQSVVFLGYFLVFISGGLLGRDWVRIFRRFCPEQYAELKKVLDKLKSQI